MKDRFIYDIKKKITVQECNAQPTDVSVDEVFWLWATNNKYEDLKNDSAKGGKWMLIYSRAQINAIWEKVKEGIKSGDLYHAKVSTTNPSNPTYAIMIYTKDYSDKKDVGRVLNYLIQEKLKPPHQAIKYKTNQQTKAGIYAGGKVRPSLYSSDDFCDTKSGKKNGAKPRKRSDALNWRKPENSEEKSSDDIAKASSSFYKRN